MMDIQDDRRRAIWDGYYRKVSLFVRLHLKRLYREDDVQEIFCKVFGALTRYNPDYSFDTWIFSIARNHCIDVHRKNNRAVKDVPQPVDELDLGDKRYAGPEDRLIAGETEQRIDKVFDSLPDGDRQIAFLRFHERLPLRKIGEITETPLGTVKYRIHEIRKAVKRSLED